MWTLVAPRPVLNMLIKSLMFGLLIIQLSSDGIQPGTSTAREIAIELQDHERSA